MLSKTLSAKSISLPDQVFPPCPPGIERTANPPTRKPDIRKQIWC